MNTHVQIKVLIEALEKKYKLLEEIINITENENTILQCSYDADMINEMYAQKQMRIDMVNSLDTTFDDIYNKIKFDLQDNPKEYSDQIIIMQSKIRSVTDLYVKIKILEEKNKLLFSAAKITNRPKTQINIPPKNPLGSYAKQPFSKK